MMGIVQSAKKVKLLDIMSMAMMELLLPLIVSAAVLFFGQKMQDILRIRVHIVG